MNTKTAIQKIKEAQAEYRALIQSIGTAGIKDLCNETLAASGATSIRWRQYTPYFNDGDPCEFSVHEADFLFQGNWTDEYQGLYTYGVDEATGKKNYNVKVFNSPAHETAYLAFQQFDGAAQQLEDVLEEVFGDHVMVTFEDDAFTVEDVDHD